LMPLDLPSYAYTIKTARAKWLGTENVAPKILDASLHHFMDFMGHALNQTWIWHELSTCNKITFSKK
jgi:hypothetical protein